MSPQVLGSPPPSPSAVDQPDSDAAEPGQSTASRKKAFVEVSLVVLIAFGPSTASAIRDLVRGIFGWPLPPYSGLAPFPSYWPNQLYGLAYWCLLALPAVLALFLLFQAGARAGDLGLWRPRWRDLFSALGLIAGVALITVLGELALKAFHNQGVFHGIPLLGASAFDAALRSLNAGFLEETVILGYLVTRLEMVGVSTPKAALVSVAARTSYHLYYGTAAVIPLLVGGLFTLYFVRFRRLLPVVAAHAAWDALLSVPRAI